MILPGLTGSFDSVPPRLRPRSTALRMTAFFDAIALERAHLDIPERLHRFRGARFRPVRGYGCGCQRHLIGSRHPRARDRGRALRRSIPRGRDAASQPVPRQAQPGGRLPGKQRRRLLGHGASGPGEKAAHTHRDGFVHILHGVQRMGKLPCHSCMGILRSHIRMDRFRRAFLLKASLGGRDLFRVQVTLVAHLMGMTPAFLTRNKLRPCCHASRFSPWR